MESIMPRALLECEDDCYDLIQDSSSEREGQLNTGRLISLWSGLRLDDVNSWTGDRVKWIMDTYILVP